MRGKGSSNTALLTVHSIGERLRLLAAKLVRPLARQSPPSSAAAESQHPSMSNYSTVDRESFQKLLASAFVVQQSQMDSQSLSAIVEVERLIMRGELDVDGAKHLLVDRTRNVANATGVAIGPPGDEPPTAADSMDGCFASFRVRPLEVKTTLFRPRDPWTPLLVILVIALVLLMGWMLGRVTWLGTADTKGPPPLVSAKPDAAPAQPEENRQADPSPPPPVPPKTRSPEAPSDSLVVYQDGKVIFRLKPSEEVGPSSPKSGESIPDPSQAPGEPSAPDPALGSLGKANLRLLQRVEPEYPEPARQQHIQGLVVLEAEVGKDGAVQQLTVISGNSMLATAASDAVRQWRFKPLVQNGRAVQFQIRIKVDFVLP
jgi:TonB family protein